MEINMNFSKIIIGLVAPAFMASIFAQNPPSPATSSHPKLLKHMKASHGARAWDRKFDKVKKRQHKKEVQKYKRNNQR